jgi:hypothetical protein
MEMTNEEIFALAMLLKGDDLPSCALREQVNEMRVLERKNTGVGFFTTIRLKKPLGADMQRQWDWNFSHQHLSHGGSFMCWLSGANTLELEAVSHNGNWPREFNAGYFMEA